MAGTSELLREAINSIIDVKEESDIDSLFSPGGTSALMSPVSGLNDFELICFRQIGFSQGGADLAGFAKVNGVQQTNSEEEAL